jgi:outer membrane protein OmpA-like peptidoglycan-associated protein
MKKYLVILAVATLVTTGTNAQLGDMIKRKAAEGVKQGAQTGTEKTIDKGIDKLFKKKDKSSKTTGDSATPAGTGTAVAGQPSPSIKTYSKYDFIPGEKIMSVDDFSQDAVGDFPAKWTTNASGEVMTVDNREGRWLNVSKQGYYIPAFIKSLPDNFTIEYDVLFIPPSTPAGPNTAALAFQVINAPSGKPTFDYGPDRSYFELDPYLGNVNIAGYTKTNEKLLSNEFQVKGIQRQNSFTYHVAVWRQKNRLRMYLNETKVVDAPSLLSADIKYNGIRFATSLNNDGSTWLISNFKLASGLPDTRSKLLNEGKFSTTGILFDVNSANIKAASYGTLKDIAAVLKENGAINVKIVGHTDSDGDNNANLELSKKRADAVKAMLVKEFSIDENRLQTDGKGETQPAVPNTTAEGKAQNRRVEFIKI